MDNNKIVLGHLYKDFTKSDFIILLVGSAFILLFAIFISVYFRILGVYIGSLILVMASVIIMIADIFAYKKSKCLCEEIIIYDEGERQFIINSYGENIFIHLTDIKAVKYKNRFLEILEPIVVFLTKNEGCIIFLQNDGKKIKTLKIKEVVSTYNEIKKIISNN